MTERMTAEQEQVIRANIAAPSAPGLFPIIRVHEEEVVQLLLAEIDALRNDLGWERRLSQEIHERFCHMRLAMRAVVDEKDWLDQHGRRMTMEGAIRSAMGHLTGDSPSVEAATNVLREVVHD